MAILAGEIVTAGRLNRMQPTTYAARATGTLAVTSTVTDVAGATVTFDTVAANAIYTVHATFDIGQIATTTNDCFGRLSVDGVLSSELAIYGGQVSSDRATVGQIWRGTLASSGSHTIKLQASTTSINQFQVFITHTGLIVTIYEVV